MTRRRQNSSKKTWLFLIIVAIICIGLALFYQYFISDTNDNHVSKDDDGIIDKIIDGIIDSEDKITVEDIVVDFDDYLTMNVQNSDKYYEREPIKGLFLTAYSAGTSSTVDRLINLANETEVNAFVIDVKNDSGRLTFDMDIPLADEIGAEYLAIKDIDELMDKLYDNNIYPIARIVSFKDPFLSSHVTDYAIKNQDGSLFYYGGISWINPYNEAAWEYIIDVAKEAANVGFKEIQFDYIRFEATYKLENADFGDIDETKTRKDIIVHFLDYANEELKDYDVVISADVFGTIITSEVDAKMIGQDYVEMAKRLDVICPMVYPSHYGRGYYGLPSDKSADFFPYEIIYGAMSDSNERYEEIGEDEKGAVVRPWLQAFTASYLDYGTNVGNYMYYDDAAIRAQIQATYDAGLKEWLLWDASNVYEPNGLLRVEDISNTN